MRTKKVLSHQAPSLIYSIWAPFGGGGERELVKMKASHCTKCTIIILNATRLVSKKVFDFKPCCSGRPGFACLLACFFFKKAHFASVDHSPWLLSHQIHVKASNELYHTGHWTPSPAEEWCEHRLGTWHDTYTFTSNSDIRVQKEFSIDRPVYTYQAQVILIFPVRNQKSKTHF